MAPVWNTAHPGTCLRMPRPHCACLVCPLAPPASPPPPTAHRAWLARSCSVAAAYRRVPLAPTPTRSPPLACPACLNATPAPTPPPALSVQIPCSAPLSAITPSTARTPSTCRPPPPALPAMQAVNSAGALCPPTACPVTLPICCQASAWNSVPCPPMLTPTTSVGPAALPIQAASLALPLGASPA